MVYAGKEMDTRLVLHSILIDDTNSMTYQLDLEMTEQNLLISGPNYSLL